MKVVEALHDRGGLTAKLGKMPRTSVTRSASAGTPQYREWNTAGNSCSSAHSVRSLRAPETPKEIALET
eukprot:1608764-Amphidinium_carterae.1